MYAREFPLFWFKLREKKKKENRIAPARRKMKKKGEFEVVYSIFDLLFQYLRHSIRTPQSCTQKKCGKKSTSFQCLAAFNRIHKHTLLYTSYKRPL